MVEGLVSALRTGRSGRNCVRGDSQSLESKPCWFRAQVARRDRTETRHVHLSQKVYNKRQQWRTSWGANCLLFPFKKGPAKEITWGSQGKLQRWDQRSGDEMFEEDTDFWIPSQKNLPEQNLKSSLKCLSNTDRPKEDGLAPLVPLMLLFLAPGPL